jgi:trans-2-enoyl-CoA reductase
VQPALPLHDLLTSSIPTALQVRGFNVRRWMRENKKKLPTVLESLAKLVNAGKLQAQCTE